MSTRPTDWSPLRDEDPTPGDPYEVAELGRKLRGMADMIDQQARNIDALSSVEGWDSDAGRAFNEVADGAAGRLKKAFKRYDEAAKALGTKVREGSETTEFASELHRAQQKADKALSDYREAYTEHQTAQREIRKYFEKYQVPEKIPDDQRADYDRWERKVNDTAYAMYQAAQDCRDAHDIFDDAGDRAARHIKDVVHHDAVHDPGGFMDFLADWADKFSNISTIMSVLAVICAVVPPLELLAPVFATLAVVASALALAGHIYDMTARGGKLDLLKLGVDVLGVIPGLGAMKGFKALQGVSKLGRLGRIGARGFQAMEGIGGKFMNGLAVKITNKVLTIGAKRLGKTLAPIEGKFITGVIKGVSFGNLVRKYVTGGIHSDHSSHGTSTPTPTPTPIPTPRPQVSPTPFHAALAA